MEYVTDNWPRIRERYEAFWHGGIIDRPLLQITAAKANRPAPVPEDVPPVEDEDALLDWFVNPQKVLPRLEREVARNHYCADAFPYIFPVSPSLVAIQAAYLGGRYSISADNLSGWCDPVIDRWEARAPLVVDGSNPWWRWSKRLLADGARFAAGRFCVGIPDLQGGGQILDLLRGTKRLCEDLLADPDPVKAAMNEIDDAWLAYWQACNELILGYQDGYCDWLRVWSERPAVTLECDFSIMISTDMFREFFLPSVERQAKWIERTIYHLDGEGAIRHLDALLELDELDAIQCEPTRGPSTILGWLPTLKRIQDHGKLLVLACLPGDVERLLAELRPEGVFIRTHCETLSEVDALIARASRRS